MKEHIGHLVPLSEASRTWNKKWYRASDVAELVKRVLKYQNGHLENCPTHKWYRYECECGYEKFITELEQIVKEGEDG